MPLEPRLVRLAEQFLEFVKRETGFDGIVCDEAGTIALATVRRRVGDAHVGAQKIVRHEADEYAVSRAEAAANPLIKEGVNLPIVIDGRRVGTFGIAGPLEITRPLARVAAAVLATWLKDMQRAHRTEAYHAELLRNLHDGVIGLDPDHIIRAWNPAAQRIFGWRAEEVIGRHFRDALTSEYLEHASYDEFIRRLDRDGRALFGVRRLARDGSWVEIEAVAAVLRDEGGHVTGYVSVNRDVTQRMRTEVQLHFAQRMASLGTLATGMAHEINSPLACIAANLAFATEQVRAVAANGDELLAALQDAAEGAARVGAVVRALDSFSRHDFHRHDAVPEPVDLVTVLQGSLRLAMDEIGRRARLVTELHPVPLVRGSTHLLEQVFLNLLLNAAQSLEGGDPGRNEIHAATRLEADGRAVVEIRDNGCGISPEIIDRIFDPFFTTKPPGSGAGLGLSICHGIITSLDGEITVESRPGCGSTFRVALPLAHVGIPGSLSIDERR
jgi:PAS domain S-box-containing protein